jgi:hypothetical protein
LLEENVKIQVLDRGRFREGIDYINNFDVSKKLALKIWFSSYNNPG